MLTVRAATGAGNDADHDAIAALFPPPPQGWRHDSLQISYDRGARLRLNPYTVAVAPQRTRMVAWRRYVRGSQIASIAIRSNDVEGIAQIDSLVAALRPDGELPRHIRHAAVHRIAGNRFVGVSFVRNGRQVRSFRIGRSGTVTIRCQSRNCGELLAHLPTIVDWRRIDKFIRALDRATTPAGSPRDP